MSLVRSSIAASGFPSQQVIKYVPTILISTSTLGAYLPPPQLSTKFFEKFVGINESSKNSRKRFKNCCLDIWTGLKGTGVSLLSLTGHVINENFERKRIVLCASELTSRHTGETIAQMLVDSLKKWDIENSKVVLILRDAGANMKRATTLGGYQSADCAAHKLNLVVQQGLLSQRSVNDVVAKCKKIASHFHKSSCNQKELEKIQKRLDDSKPVLKLVQQCPTRWTT